MLIGIPDRSGWKVPDNSWTDSGRPVDALVIEARRLNRTLSDPPSHCRWVVDLRDRGSRVLRGSSMDALIEYGRADGQVVVGNLE